MNHENEMKKNIHICLTRRKEDRDQKDELF